MDRILLKDLSTEALQALYARNAWLQKQCEEQREFSNDQYISDIADIMRRAKYTDFCIGGDRNDHISTRNGYYAEYFDMIIDLQDTLCVLSDDIAPMIKRLSEKAAFYDSCCLGYEDISDKRFCCFEKWFLAGVEKINDCILDYCQTIATYYEGLQDELYLVIDSIGGDYETDGEYIYEVSVRKYA